MDQQLSPEVDIHQIMSYILEKRWQAALKHDTFFLPCLCCKGIVQALNYYHPTLLLSTAVAI